MRMAILVYFVMFFSFNSVAQAEESSPFGTNLQPTWDMPLGSEKTWVPFDSANSLGVTWFRVLFAWDAIEKNGKGDTDWTYTDKVVKQCQQNPNSEILGSIHYTPGMGKRTATFWFFRLGRRMGSGD